MCDEIVGDASRLVDSTQWYQNGMSLEPPEENLDFTDTKIDILFATEERDGNYTCTYLKNSSPDSIVDGMISPMCIIVLGE